MRERGGEKVAPHAGAWIETLWVIILEGGEEVAPHAGAWIETLYDVKKLKPVRVAPHAGAWIETPGQGIPGLSGAGRPPCGGVD